MIREPNNLPALAVFTIALVGCGGSPSAPEAPRPENGKIDVRVIGTSSEAGLTGEADKRLKAATWSQLLITGTFDLSSSEGEPPPVHAQIVRLDGNETIIVNTGIVTTTKRRDGVVEYSRELNAPKQSGRYVVRVIDGLSPKTVVASCELEVTKHK